MVDMEVIVERHCEKCKTRTRQELGWDNWFRPTTKCLAMVPNKIVIDGVPQILGKVMCEEIHIFTLSHLQSGCELVRPFTRQDLGIVVTERK